MIRKAEVKDIDRINLLLGEILEIHANIRPDIFIPGTTKYTNKELEAIINCDATPIFVYEESGVVLGHAFCQIKSHISNNIKSYKSLYIDDLCVLSSARGKSIGKKLLEYVKEFASSIGCYEVTLNVWEGNDNAKAFYEKMGFKVKETMLEFVLD